MTDPVGRSTINWQFEPPWLEWVTRKDDRLETFLADDVAAMPADLWSSTGLQHAEHALLQRFPGTAVEAGDEVLTRFGCYLGEVFVRALQGFWLNDPFPYASPRATVRFVYTDARIAVYDEVVLALHHRTGTRWSDLHTALSARCAAWWESGHSSR
ncbi:hypothetical protein [Nocardia wallacei]|uniref:hypothetical protein n=1 Tax=Nocardia wallacei TaxID=480035 RepID=UPI00245835EA|nr:hypothetical protein [Nocardia wallacei]